jgi:hypothetical protein
MPPFRTPITPLPRVSQPPIYCSATCHPVFFTQSLLKPPFPLPNGANLAVGLNPVAFGYIHESARHSISTESVARTKL